MYYVEIPHSQDCCDLKNYVGPFAAEAEAEGFCEGTNVDMAAEGMEKRAQVVSHAQMGRASE